MEEKTDCRTLIIARPPYGEGLDETKSTPSHGELFAALASATTDQLVNELKRRGDSGITTIIGPSATVNITAEGPCIVFEIDD